MLLLTISDNGTNHDGKLDIEDSLGLKIIHEIIDKNLRGKWKVHFDKGLIHELEFQCEKMIFNKE